jgi:thymidylate synthase ThyX
MEKSIDELRQVMGTNPKEKTPLKTEFFEGVRGIKVALMDNPVNPYKAMFNMATSTWGNKIDKWKETTPEARYWVVKSVLEFRSLPLAMESPSFSFSIEGCSRSAFDQIARARIGAVFASMGWRDNDHSDIGFRVPQSIWNDKESLEDFKITCITAKNHYHNLVEKGKSSWQDARAHLPISALHNFSMAMNYMALRGFCNKRLKFCEQADTVAVAWLIREEMLKSFPLMGSYLRPSCDNKGICEYHNDYAMSEAFGCLFKECGRNKCLAIDEYASFNFSCSDKQVIETQLNLYIPNAKENMPVEEYKDLSDIDKKLFNN